MAFPWVDGMVYDLCVYYMTGTPEGSTESGFMEKPGIEPATPGLQGIRLIHYTTGASFLLVSKNFLSWSIYYTRPFFMINLTVLNFTFCGSV